MRYTQEINTRMMFRFYDKSERRYLTEKESRRITYNSMQLQTRYAIEQSTGFFNKGRCELIFEGDVVQDDAGRIGIVYYEQIRGQYLFGEYWKMSDESLEIIGNCHDKTNQKTI